jgi:hypothetical protein
MSRRLIIWGGGIFAVVLIATIILAYLIDEPLLMGSGSTQVQANSSKNPKDPTWISY